MKNNFPLQANDTDKTPLIETGFYQWARTVNRSDVGVMGYLASIGFVVGTHVLSETGYKTLSYCVEAFHRVEPYMQPRKLADCFTKTDVGGFYVAGMPAGRYNPALGISESLASAGWIYDVTPESTYFEVITQNTGHRVLFAKYQQIIGSRALCELLEG